jgi:hypothetical protein
MFQGILGEFLLILKSNKTTIMEKERPKHSKIDRFRKNENPKYGMLLNFSHT